MSIQGNIPGPNIPYTDQISTQLQQMGQNIQNDLTTITDQLEHSILGQNATIQQNYINQTDPSQPKLPPTGSTISEADNLTAIKGNPWLAANPLATFTITFLEMSYTLAKLKLAEAKLSQQTILAMTSLTKEVAKLTKEIGEMEAIGDFVSAGVALGSGITNLVGGKIALGGKNAGEIQAKMAMVTGITQFFNAADSVVKGFIAIQKSGLEATKMFAENEKQLMQDQLGKLSDAYRTAGDMLDQILQTLTKYYDESYRAFGWQIH